MNQQVDQRGPCGHVFTEAATVPFPQGPVVVAFPARLLRVTHIERVAEQAKPVTGIVGFVL